MTKSTLFARARVLFHVYKTDNSLKLFKWRQISVISHIKLSDHEATLSHSKWVGFQTKSYIIARPPHEPPAILSCTPGVARYPFDLTQLWHG